MKLSTLAGWMLEVRSGARDALRQTYGTGARLSDHEFDRLLLERASVGRQFHTKARAVDFDDEDLRREIRRLTGRARAEMRDAGGDLPWDRAAELHEDVTDVWRECARRATAHDYPRRALSTARHEAGHLVAALADGAEPEGAVLFFRRDGRELFPDGGAVYPDLTRPRSAASQLAGIAADRMFGASKGDPGEYASSDLERARGFTDDVDGAMRKAEAVVREHALAVSKIANVIATRGRIDGAEAARLYRRYRGQGSQRRKPRPTRSGFNRILAPAGIPRPSRAGGDRGRQRAAWPARR